MLTHLPLGDSGTRRLEILPAHDIDVSMNSRLNLLFFLAQYLLPCCRRPVMGRMAMLGPPLHNGLYSMAWTVLAGWR